MKIDKNYFLLYYDSFMTYLSLFHAQTIIFILKWFLCWKEGTGSVYKRWFGLGTGSLRVSTHMTHWQYPPHQWAQVKLLTMVRKVAFGVCFSVLLILEKFCRNSLLKFQIHFSNSWIIFTGTACLRFYKEKKHI